MSEQTGLYKSALVTKRNVLNEMRSNGMTLQELRFFSIYLSKINPWDTSSRIVRFPLSDFLRIMGLGRIKNMNRMMDMAESFLTKTVCIPTPRGGFDAISLFSRFKFDKDESDEWYVEISASSEAMPLLFEFKNRYFSYELWNTLQLSSSNQIRMYEILKQYEKIGKREIEVNDLREMLGINKDEYLRWDNFKSAVLDTCQEALTKNTDICYTYERGKSGRGGKWLSIIFHIRKNDNYVNPLSLDEFIELQPYEPPKYDGFELLADACNNEFTPAQMNEIFSIICVMDIPEYNNSIDFGRYHFLQKAYAKLNTSAELNEAKGTPIRNRFKYFLSLLSE